MSLTITITVVCPGCQTCYNLSPLTKSTSIRCPLCGDDVPVIRTSKFSELSNQSESDLTPVQSSSTGLPPLQSPSAEPVSDFVAHEQSSSEDHSRIKAVQLTLSSTSPRRTRIKLRNVGMVFFLQVVTLTFYSFYLVPAWGRSMKRITGRPRLGFGTAFVLGVLTCGIVPMFLCIIYAFDLDNSGERVSLPNRRSRLGPLVLVLTAGTFAAAFMCAEFGFILSLDLEIIITLLLQDEINTHARWRNRQIAG